MAVNKIRSFILCLAVAICLIGCNNSFVQPTIEPVITPISPTQALCAAESVFHRNDVQWVEWSPDGHAIFYEIENDPNYWSFSVLDRKETRGLQTYEDYLAGLAIQWNIPSNSMSVSPDESKIIYSIKEIVGATATPPSNLSELSGEMPANDFIERVFLKYSDGTDFFLVDIHGLIDKMVWSADSEKVAVMMSAYSAGARDSDDIYVIDVNQKTVRTILAYDASRSNYDIRGFSNNGQWIFTAQGRNKREAQNIIDGRKATLELPSNTLNWWGYDKNTILIQTDVGREDQILYSESLFAWYTISENQLKLIDGNIYEVQFARSKAVSPSLDFEYLAIVDQYNRLSVITLCKPEN